MSVALSVHAGPSLQPHLEHIARLRIEVFRAFPYLYEGDMDYERGYLQTYLDCDNAAVVLARDGEQVVGASTCLPMAAEEDAFRQPLEQLGVDTERVFYLAESVLRPGYRGQGLGVGFFEQREAFARQLGGFEHACFCAVVRPEDHPLRPADYTPLDAFWRRRGYAPLDAHASYSWLDIDRDEPTSKSLRFWIKTL